jgi:hypothetical protein
MSARDDNLTQRQRDAIWKWRWLGFRDSTPAFKASMVVLAIPTAYLVITYLKAQAG